MKTKKNLSPFTQRMFLLSTLLLLFFTSNALAQQQIFQSDTEQPVQVIVNGESTLHAWKANCKVVNDYPAELSLNLEEGGLIESFAFSVEVKSMESGRGSTMDGKIFKALKSEEHPYIKYEQTEPAKLSNIGEDGSFSLVSTGVLKMAGAEKEISVDVAGALQDGVLTFSASHDLKMTEYEIVPPSAMFGQIKTKDDVTITFEFRYLAKK